MKHEELTHKIIGCAMKVHSTLGNGFQEVIYQGLCPLKWVIRDYHLIEKWK